MDNLFILKSESLELLSFVASNLVKECIDFSFSSDDCTLNSSDSYSLDYFADEFCCNCDCCAKYELFAGTVKSA